MPGLDDLVRIERLAWEAVEGAPVAHAVRALCDALGRTDGCASLIDTETGRGMDSGFAYVEPHLVRRLATEFSTVETNPSMRAFSRQPPGRLQHVGAVEDMRALKRSRFYADWWLPTGVPHHAGGIVLPAPDGRLVWVVIACLGDRDWLDAGDLRFAEAACGSIARALRTLVTLEQERAEATLVGAMPDPAWLLGPSGDVRLANAEGRAMLEMGTGPVIRRGRSVALGSRDADARLKRLIGAACAAGGSGAVLVRDGVGHARLAVEPGPAHRGGGSALVRLRRPHALAWSTEDLRAAFDLTPREAEVARALAGGARPDEIGRALGLTPGSVRLYLKRAFAKTGTDGQVPLIALLLGAPPRGGPSA